MIEFLNDIQGLVAIIGVIVTIIIAIIGFFINKNISKINISQKNTYNSPVISGDRKNEIKHSGIGDVASRDIYK